MVVLALVYQWLRKSFRLHEERFGFVVNLTHTGYVGIRRCLRLDALQCSHETNCKNRVLYGRRLTDVASCALVACRVSRAFIFENAATRWARFGFSNFKIDNGI